MKNRERLAWVLLLVQSICYLGYIKHFQNKLTEMEGNFTKMEHLARESNQQNARVSEMLQRSMATNKKLITVVETLEDMYMEDLIDGN